MQSLFHSKAAECTQSSFIQACTRWRKGRGTAQNKWCTGDVKRHQVRMRGHGGSQELSTDLSVAGVGAAAGGSASSNSSFGSGKYSTSTGYVRPGTVMTGQPPKYLHKHTSRERVHKEPSHTIGASAILVSLQVKTSHNRNKTSFLYIVEPRRTRIGP